MNKAHFTAITLILFSMSLSAYNQDIKLPEPNKKGGMPLMQALNERKSSREYDSRKLSEQQLSDLLWAAWGINRPDGKHTAPSSNDKQEMSVYAALESGLYLYIPESLTLKQIHNRDIRKETGRQDFVEVAAVNLVYVADLIKSGVSEPEKAGPEALNKSAINTGFMAQNVYLWCASEKLACVVRAFIDIPVLTKAMELAPHQRIIISQTVGYPKK
jgi:nitroreductase